MSFVNIASEGNRPDLTDVSIEITNFRNPYSNNEVTSLRISSYRSTDCSGDAESSRTMAAQSWFSLITPSDQFSLISQSNVLGDSDPGNKIVFKFTPIFTTSPDGRGLIGIRLPSWYDVGGKLTMMYNEQARNKCTSEDMEITSSIPDLINKSIMIRYKNMKPEKIAGAQLTITCQSFKNPIYQKKWYGFRISIYDSEPIPNPISSSESIAFDATGMEPAIIPRNGLTVTPTIFKIAEYSIWVFSLKMPIPLETECYIRLTIPSDLTYQNTMMKGQQMMAPMSSDIIDNNTVKVETAPDGSKILSWRACFRETTVGPSPQGRLEINRI